MKTRRARASKSSDENYSRHSQRSSVWLAIKCVMYSWTSSTFFSYKNVAAKCRWSFFEKVLRELFESFLKAQTRKLLEPFESFRKAKSSNLKPWKYFKNQNFNILQNPHCTSVIKHRNFRYCSDYLCHLRISVLNLLQREILKSLFEFPRFDFTDDLLRTS